MTFDLTEQEHKFVLNAIALGMSTLIAKAAPFQGALQLAVAEAVDSGVTDSAMTKLDPADWAASKGVGRAN